MKNENATIQLRVTVSAFVHAELFAHLMQTPNAKARATRMTHLMFLGLQAESGGAKFAQVMDKSGDTSYPPEAKSGNVSTQEVSNQISTVLNAEDNELLGSLLT
jgi:hypothetical protein